MTVLRCSFLLTLAIATACGANEGILKSGKEPTSPTNTVPVQRTFAQELEEFRTADYRYIFVIRRKDGGTIDAADRRVIKLNTDGADRRVSADNGQAFIIGTNNPIPPNNIAAIHERFAVEDHSQEPISDSDPPANGVK